VRLQDRASRPKMLLLGGYGESMEVAVSRYISLWFELRAFALIEQNQHQYLW
jgi:hypothetical protein